MVKPLENLHCATLELVRSTSIKQRLISAARHLTPLAEDQLPNDETRGSFAQLMRSLAGVQPQRGEDAVVASVRKMSNQQADDCAALIVEIFGALCRVDSLAQRPQTTVSSIVQLLDRPPLDRQPLERQQEEFQVPVLSATN
jgi:hypothetical protein